MLDADMHLDHPQIACRVRDLSSVQVAAPRDKIPDDLLEVFGFAGYVGHDRTSHGTSRPTPRDPFIRGCAPSKAGLSRG